MPIYEYQCASCASQFDVLTSLGAPSPPCPECRGTTRRLMSSFANINAPKKGTVAYERDTRRQKGLSPEP